LKLPIDGVLHRGARGRARDRPAAAAGVRAHCPGRICRAQGDYRGAVDAYEQALARFDATRDLHNRHDTLVNIARVCVASGKLNRAKETLASAIRLVREMGTMYRGHFALEVSPRFAAARGDGQAAALMQGASDTAVDKMGGMRVVRRSDRRAVAGSSGRRARCRAHAAACAAGRATSLEVAPDQALRWLDA